VSELRRVLADNRLVARPRYHPPRHQPSSGDEPKPRDDVRSGFTSTQPARSTVMLTAKSIKATVVLDAAALLDVTVANGSGPVPFFIAAGKQTLSTGSSQLHASCRGRMIYLRIISLSKPAVAWGGAV
jgi:hypothetical protein